MHIVSGYWLWVICATINSFCRAHYQGCRGAECYHLVLCVTAGDVWLCDAEWDHTLWFVTLSPRPPPASQLQMGLLVTSRSSRCTSRSISGALLAKILPFFFTSFELYPSLGCHSHRYAYFGSPSHTTNPLAYTKLVWSSFRHCHPPIMWLANVSMWSKRVQNGIILANLDLCGSF